MRLFGRNDLLLASGLTVALLVVFSEPVANLLDYAHRVETARRLQLLPALVILAFVFILHQLWKRQELRARTLAADAAAKEATDRAADMTRLVAFGQALARSLDIDSIRVAAAAHLPLLVPGRGIWAMLWIGSTWTPLMVVGDSTQEEREISASDALGLTPLDSDSDASPHAAADLFARASTEISVPMLVANKPVGALGVCSTPRITSHQESMLAAAAALLAVSLRNAELFREVRENSVRDALTGCSNRAHMLEVFEVELRRARRSHTPISILMFDLDRFKEINDRHGHLCGDLVLSSIGLRMESVLRGGDLKCRYGGEEFVVLLLDTPLAGAQHVAENLRRDIEDHPVRWEDQLVPVTASFGVTSVEPDDVEPLDVLARADRWMYQAKQGGRNRVRVGDSKTTTLDDRHWKVAR